MAIFCNLAERTNAHIACARNGYKAHTSNKYKHTLHCDGSPYIFSLGISIPSWEFLNVRETHYEVIIGKFNSQGVIPGCAKTHYEATTGKRNSQLGIPKSSETHYEVTIGDFSSQLGIRKRSETHYELTIGNFNSQLGIRKCSETHYEMTIGNFNSQLGIRKCSETHYEMTIGNLTPFGELKIYKRNGVGRGARRATACQAASAGRLAL